MYYPRWELQRRLTLFFSAAILAGAFSGVSGEPNFIFGKAIYNSRVAPGICSCEHGWHWRLQRMALDIHH